MPASLTPTELFEDDTDLLYEEDILRNGYSLKYWWRYMEAKQRAPAKQRNMIAERALKHLPGSYKVWHHYLKDRREQVLHRRPGDQGIENLNRTYERALVTMHKMPRIWLDYLEFLSGQHRTTVTRQTFDRALRALPITQHEMVWALYLRFARECPIKETAVRVYRRYLQFDPEGVEEYVDFLLSIGRVSEAALKLAEMLNRVADNYDEDVDNAVAGITSIIEPVMIVFLAVVVGFIVIALFLPIVEIIKQLTG